MKDKKIFFAIGIAVIIIALIIVVATNKNKKPAPVVNPGQPVKEIVEDNTIKDIYGVNLMSDVFEVSISKIGGEPISYYSVPAFVSEYAGTSFFKAENNSDFSYNDIKDTEEYYTVYNKEKQPILYMIPIDGERFFISTSPIDQNNFKDFIYVK